MDISQLIESFEYRFGAAGIDNAKRVTEEMLAEIFGCQPLEIYTKEFSAYKGAREQMALLRKIEALAKRIEKGEPLQYVIGHVNFWGLKIHCDKRALIPRPETEILVEEVLNSTLWKKQNPTIVDIGTGSGCIVLTLAHQRADGKYIAIDLSSDALELAKENAKTHGLHETITFKNQSLLDNFSEKSIDCVVANLPYISSSNWEQLPKTVKDYEPQLALDSGRTGIELIEDLCLKARTVLRPQSHIFLEFGFDQGALIQNMLEKLGYIDIKIRHDLAGLDRIVLARTP